MQTTHVLRTFSLINQTYTPTDALEMLSGMVQEYTRQQNIRMLRSWEHDHCFNSEKLRQEIKTINTRYQVANAMISEAQQQHPNIKVTISIEIADANPTREILEKRDSSDN